MKSRSKSFLFLHGGPGLNSEAERQILGPLLMSYELEISFFDEPSLLRPRGPMFDQQGASRGLIASAAEALHRLPGKVTLIGVSFGARVAEHLVAEFPEKLEKFVAISPTHDLEAAFFRMMHLAEQDYREAGSKLELQIREARYQVRSLYDGHCKAALALAQADPQLFSHYWFKPEVMADWGKTLSLPGFEFDLLSQQTIFQEVSEHDRFHRVKKSAVPLTLMLGKADPLLDEPTTLSVYREKFMKMEVVHFAESGHFPHLEEPEKFLSILSGQTV